MHYSLEPEVAGELGEHTVLDTSVHPPLVSNLHYQLSDWLGDDILESFPCYIATKSLKVLLEQLGGSGCEFGDVEVTTSEEFEELHAQLIIPDFYWLKVTGAAGIDDFGISKDFQLVVSDQVLSLLKAHAVLNNCDIEPYEFDE